MIRKLACGAGTLVASLFVTTAAFAQDAAAAAAPTVDKGDTAWMMTSTVLVLMMIVPGLALFYGGLARTKNMLSVMTQVGAVAALTMIVWVGWGYAEAFGDGGNPFFASFSNVIVSVGGDMRVRGGAQPGECWPIGVGDTIKTTSGRTTEHAAVVAVGRGGLATSGGVGGGSAAALVFWVISIS